MTNRWESFLNGINLEQVPNEKIFPVGSKKIRPECFLPQLNCYFITTKEENKEKILVHEFCSGVKGFALLVAFGEPHDLDMKLFSEVYLGNRTVNGCISVRFAGFRDESKGRRYIKQSLIAVNESNPVYASIHGFGFSNGSVHAIQAYTLLSSPPGEIEKPEIFATYSDKDLMDPIYDHFYIISDFRDHETVRGYGGRWDPDAKMWYFNDPDRKDECKKALDVIIEARIAEKELHKQEGWNKVRAMAEKIDFSSFETKKAVNEAVDKIWKDVKEEYKFTKKEVIKFVGEHFL